MANDKIGTAPSIEVNSLSLSMSIPLKNANGKKRKRKLVLEMPEARAVYVGCNATDAFVRKIKNVSGIIPVYKMEKKDGEYGLIPKKV